MTAKLLVIAATGSGVGKTSVTVGLARALRRRGQRVRTAKVGPDFLDPRHLAQASGQPCLNLDTYMMGEDYVRRLVAEATLDTDWLLIEGVMGLFDGSHPTHSQGSTAEIARLLDAPIVLIADARGQARSFAATVHGFTQFEPNLKWAGVIANHVGSARHAALLTEALGAASLPPLVAFFTKGQLPHLDSRHLGLLAPRGDGDIDALATAVEGAIALERLERHVRSLSTPPVYEAPLDDAPRTSPLRLAIASDEAFGFVYADFLERLQDYGVELLPFSPLAERTLPEAAEALFLPGGYPEVFAEALADNVPLLTEISRFAAHRPVYAECGGLMLLAEALVDGQGIRYPMAGVFPFSTRMQSKVTRLGYCEVTLTDDAHWGRRTDRCRGHEFHYSTFELEPDATIERCYDVAYRNGTPKREGFRRGRTLASYVHLHLSSRPQLLSRFLSELSR